MNEATTGTVSMSTCPHCGGWHNGACPQVRAIEYWPNGSVKRVEYERGQGGVPVQQVGRQPLPDDYTIKPIWQVQEQPWMPYGPWATETACGTEVHN
jgi:hypothetical protein